MDWLEEQQAFTQRQRATLDALAPNPAILEAAEEPPLWLKNDEGTGQLQNPWTYAGLLPIARGPQAAGAVLQGARNMGGLLGRGNTAGNLMRGGQGGGGQPPAGGQLPPPGGQPPALRPGTQVGQPRTPGTEVGPFRGPKDMGWAQRVLDEFPALQQLPGGAAQVGKMATSESLSIRLLGGAAMLGAVFAGIGEQDHRPGQAELKEEALFKLDDNIGKYFEWPEIREEVNATLDEIDREVPDEVLESLPEVPAEIYSARAHQLEAIIKEWEATKPSKEPKHQGWGVRALRMLVPALAGIVAGPLGVLAGGTFGFLQGEVDAHNIENRHSARVDNWYKQRLEMEEALIGQQDKDIERQFLLPRKLQMEDWDFIEGQRKAGREVGRDKRDAQMHDAKMRALDRQDAFAGMYLDALGGGEGAVNPALGQVADPRLNAKVISENARNIIARYHTQLGPDLFKVFTKMIDSLPLAEGANKSAAEAGILVELILDAAANEAAEGNEGPYTQMAQEMYQTGLAGQQANNLKTLKSLSGI